MSYRHMNFGANISWNKKELVRALIEERAPRRRPTSRDEIIACTHWNKYARMVDREPELKSMEQFAVTRTGFETAEEWFQHMVKQTNEYTPRARFKTSQSLEEDRTDRQMQGGSRKKGGRVGWPSTKTIK